MQHESLRDRLSVRVPVRASGRTMWQLLDEHGRLDHEATRRAGGGRWNHNLITDAGLVSLFANPTAGDAARTYLVVGDGSGAPDPGDTALSSFVAATNGTGGIADTAAQSKPADDVVVAVTRTRELTAGANLNLSEYGYSSVGSGSSLAIRELFRDGGGTPTTVNVLQGRKLRVTHELSGSIPYETSVSFDVERYDVGGNLVDTDAHTGKMYAIAGDPMGVVSMDAEKLYGLIGSAPKVGGSNRVQAWAYSTPPSVPAYDGVVSQSGATTVAEALGLRAYTSGATRTRYLALSETQFSGSMKALYLRYASSGSGSSTPIYGLLLILDDPQAIAKSNLQTFALDVTMTYARAA